MFSFEVWLVLGVVGFYLYDLIMLLSINELLLTKSDKGWSYKFPEFSYQLLRKYLLLPNPLTPDVAIFRVSWPKEPSSSANDNRLVDFISILEPIQASINTLLLLLLLFIPMVSLVYGSGTKLLIIFGMIYIFILTALVYIFNNRDKLYLSNGKFLSLAFESIACPPFALNMVRKISLNYPNLGDPAHFAKHMFDGTSKSKFCKDLNKSISKDMTFLDVDSRRYLRLQSYLNSSKEILS